MQRWDELLVEDHEWIERAMAVMERELDALRVGVPASRALARAVDFLLEFGDKLHNQKEERHLFPRMGAAGIPVQGGPIGVMLMEHEAERTLLTRFAAALPTLHTYDLRALNELIAEGRAYLRVRAEHIWKENDVLYAMARRVLPPREADAITAAIAEMDVATYGPSARAAFGQMVAEIEGSGKRRSLVENLSYDQLHAVLEALPVEVTFVDADNVVAYFNRLDKPKIFPRTRSVVGRKVEMCHPAHSVDKVMQIVAGFRAGTLDKADFWIDLMGEKVLIRYFPVRDDDGRFLGVLEVTQEIGWIQALKGQKRLLDA